MALETMKYGELHASDSAAFSLKITFKETLEYALAGCPNSADYSEYSPTFSSDEFDEVFKRNKKAWEKLAQL